MRSELKNLGTKDPAAAKIVRQGARLSQERSALEQRLELLRGDASQAIGVEFDDAQWS